MQTVHTNKWLFYFTNVACCFLLLFPALYNGYPLVNSDFGTFLPSGFKPAMPVDRPITYGILLRIFSFNGFSLWTVLFFQAFVVVNLIMRIVKMYVKSRYLIVSVLIITFLSFCTGLSWTVSQLQPDIFTAVAFMCLALLLMQDEGKPVTILTCILYFVAIGTHISHVMIFFLLLLATIVMYRKRYREQKKKYWLLAVLSVAPVFIMLPPIAKSNHMFIMGSLLDKGILKQYLDDNCSSKQYKLCAYKDNLPATGDDFIWDPQLGPAYKEGGWAAVKPEYDAIKKDLFSQPRYIWMFAQKSAIFTWKELCTFDIGPGNIPFHKGTFVYDGIELYVPSEIDEFLSSLQNTDQLLDKIAPVNKWFSYVILAGISGIVLQLLVYRKRIGHSTYFLIFMSMACILVNAWNCGTFSSINGRYGCRLAWLLPFVCILIAFEKARRKRLSN